MRMWQGCNFIFFFFKVKREGKYYLSVIGYYDNVNFGIFLCILMIVFDKVNKLGDGLLI